MRGLLILTIFTVVLYSVRGNHLVVGNIANRVDLVYSEEVEYFAIPFKKRVKYFFYSSPTNKPIAGVQALDNYHSKSSINITAGGVGYPHVSIRMKSERGSGLSYNIGIYAQTDYL